MGTQSDPGDTVLHLRNMETFFAKANMAEGTSGTLCNGFAHRMYYQVQSTLKNILIESSAMSGVVGAIYVIVDCPSAQGSRAQCRALAPSVRRKHRLDPRYS